MKNVPDEYRSIAVLIQNVPVVAGLILFKCIDSKYKSDSTMNPIFSIVAVYEL